MAHGPWQTKERDLWIARWGASCIRVYREVPGHVVIWRCSIDEHDDLSEVVRDVLHFAGTDPRLIVTWETPDRLLINRALLDAGATVHRRKLFVERELTGADLPSPGRFEWQTLAESGSDAFREVLWEASQGDPFEGPDRDPKREWTDAYPGVGPSPRTARLHRRGERTVPRAAAPLRRVRPGGMPPSHLPGHGTAARIVRNRSCLRMQNQS